MIDDNELKEIEKRAKKATRGPWVSGVFFEIRSGDQNGEPICNTCRNEEDEIFIKHARDDIPKLIKEVRRLKKATNDIVDMASSGTILVVEKPKKYTLTEAEVKEIATPEGFEKWKKMKEGL